MESANAFLRNLLLACIPCIRAECRLLPPACHRAQAADLATLLYSLAALSFRPPRPWLAALFRTTLPWLLLGPGAGGSRCFSARDIARMLWALATLKYAPPSTWLGL